MKNILIVGNLGYIGPVVVSHFRKVFPQARLVGYDSGFFAHALTGASANPERFLNEQLYGDVRDIRADQLQGFDAVVILAAVSNDPMGKRFEQVTDDINHVACSELARKASASGVARIVFASSCSMYGYAEGGARREQDDLNPLTAYARSKVATEVALKSIDHPQAVVTSLRFSTACGMSDRLRLDLVLNDFVACAMANREITVLSDGSPWRPLIEVRDMARAIEWALVRDPAEGGKYLAVNVGVNRWNYQVKDLAQAVAAAVPGTTVSINTSAPPDKRSYKVDFALYEKLAPNHQPLQTLESAIADLIEGLQRMGFADKNFRESTAMRLKVLESHMEAQRINEQLRWLA